MKLDDEIELVELVVKGLAKEEMEGYQKIKPSFAIRQKIIMMNYLESLKRKKEKS